MMSEEDRNPEIASYIEIVDHFIGGGISAAEFERSLLSAIKSERRELGGLIYPLLQGLFEDADAYVEEPRLRRGPDDLNENQLWAAACKARQALRDLGY